MIDLKPYVKRRVVIHLKQPYTYQLIRSHGGKPVPLAIAQTQDGKMAIADANDPSARALTVDVMVGVVIERDGRYLLEMEDQSSRQGHRIEAEISADIIHFVSVVREDTVVTLS